MAFDGIVMNSLVSELREKILGGRIDKIYQPEKDEIVLTIRAKGENQSLLISSNSSNPRIHLTKSSKTNPLEPPMFCMILRKHMQGASIIGIEQVDMDRIIKIHIESRDELGLESKKTLVIEIMGRHSNIIFIEDSTSKVIDSITRVSREMSSVRQVYPGSLYTLPPEQDKVDLLDETYDKFINRTNSLEDDKASFKFIYMEYQGISPIFAREICYKAQLDPTKKISTLAEDELDKLWSSIAYYIDRIKNENFSPSIASDGSNNKILGFHCFKLEQFPNSSVRDFEYISDLLDFYYVSKDKQERINQKSQSLSKLVNNNLDKARKKLKKQINEFNDAKDREIYKIYADLISANIYRIEKGSKNVLLENFYDEEMKTIEVPLNEKKSAAQNAQNYYKKYSRLKNAYNLLQEQIPLTRSEIEYLENVAFHLDSCETIADLDEIREELISSNYIVTKKKKRKNNNIQSQPYHYVSPEGYDIYVGKNNRQNDEVTFKMSSREDLWLHVQNMPGSHVIIRNAGKEISEKTLEDAAKLAALNSRAKNSLGVSVDYTERKHVRKQKAAPAGLVFYENFRTIIVDPNIDNLSLIEKK